MILNSEKMLKKNKKKTTTTKKAKTPNRIWKGRRFENTLKLDRD